MKDRNRDTFNEINITPLTDIFLVLLIIMMVIAPMLDQQGLNLTVPDMVDKSTSKETKMIDVQVTADNTYVMDGHEISVNDLGSAIKEKAQTSPDGMLIEASPESSHGAVVKVMDTARNSGVTNMSVQEGS
ncbi:biopolymer transporter ExbD [bacterium]|nr:biopolymer transporter ExbD [bacterium]